MVALSNYELMQAGNIPKKLAEQYAVARAKVSFANYLGESDEEAKKLIRQIEDQYPAFLAIYDAVVNQVVKASDLFASK